MLVLLSLTLSSTKHFSKNSCTSFQDFREQSWKYDSKPVAEQIRKPSLRLKSEVTLWVSVKVGKRLLLPNQGLLWFVNYKKGLFIPNQQNTAAPTQAEMSGPSVALGEAFNKRLLKRPESAGSSSTLPYFIQGHLNKVWLTLRPDLPKTSDCFLQSGRYRWNRLVFSEKNGFST